MKSKTIRAFAGLLIALALSCSDSSGDQSEQLDCQWFLSDSNCWNTTIRPALECLPRDEFGEMSADRSSCAFPDGTSIAFSAPVIPDLPGETSVSTDSGKCFDLVDRGRNRNTFILETRAGNYVQVLDDTSLTITCPDASVHSMALSSLSNCGDETGLGVVFEDFLIPSAAWVLEGGGSSTAIELQLSPAPANPTGAPDGWHFTAFRCASAE